MLFLQFLKKLLKIAALSLLPQTSWICYF